MASTVVYLVTGANRGIGLGLVQVLARQNDTIVFAGARVPATASELQTLASEYPGKVHILQIVSGDESGNESAVREIKEKAGRLDVVVANAGIAKWVGPSVTAPAQEMLEHFQVNVIGALVLFQACYELLKASGGTHKFVMISSCVGSIEQIPTVGGVLPYGTSKAAENYLSRKLHFDHAKEGFVVFSMCPGNVDTDMQRGVRKLDALLSKAPLAKPVEEVVPMLLARIEEATTDKIGGQFIQYDGKRIPW